MTSEDKQWGVWLTYRDSIGGDWLRRDGEVWRGTETGAQHVAQTGTDSCSPNYHYTVKKFPAETPAAHDPVNHPQHYTSHPSGIECIQITEHMGFNLGNATKYIWRADLKHDAIEDLKKAAWYLAREIERREKKPLVRVPCVGCKNFDNGRCFAEIQFRDFSCREVK
jgi:hypothetical protein